MEIERIDTYKDSRFREEALRQHGCFLVDGIPCEVEITGKTTAVIRLGELPESGEAYKELIETFRFYAEHITRFLKEDGTLIAEFPPVELFPVTLSEIQPSQFFVDEEKLRAVEVFISDGEEIVIPLIRYGERYLSCDGHTRLYLAAKKGFSTVRGFLAEENEVLLEFAAEAQKRGVFTPMDLKLLPHEEYEQQWNRFCEEFFREREERNH